MARRPKRRPPWCGSRRPSTAPRAWACRSLSRPKTGRACLFPGSPTNSPPRRKNLRSDDLNSKTQRRLRLPSGFRHGLLLSSGSFVSLVSLWLTFLTKTEPGADKVGQSYETILVERRGSIAIITINRPEKRNALNIQTRAEGAAVLDELRADDSVRVVVFTGAGDKAFIAGADIAEFANRTAITQREVMLERGLFNAIETFPKPVIAMINGSSLGVRCDPAFACDILFATPNSSFSHPRSTLASLP